MSLLTIIVVIIAAYIFYKIGATAIKWIFALAVLCAIWWFCTNTTVRINIPDSPKFSTDK